MSIAFATTEAEILAEVIAPDRDDMPPDVARFVLKFAFSEVQKEQMLELADKNNRGTLTDAERAIMENYRRVGHILAIMQAQARISLKHAGQNAS
jgi:hypothetical protein